MMSRSHGALIVWAVIASDPARAPRFVDRARSPRSGAWLLERSRRHPRRLPAGRRSERFARRVDAIRSQLAPITSLEALADSFAREAGHVLRSSPSVAGGWAAGRRELAAATLEAAYLARWMELEAGVGSPLQAWPSLCGGPDAP